MRNKILAQKFFNRPTPTVARELLGKFLVRKYKGKIMAAMITEIEVYDGFKDKGSHARNGQTARNWPMFGPAGHWYVYFTYGMHWMLNIVTREAKYPAAVLIRGVEGVNGPGRLTKYFHIAGDLSGKKAEPKTGLWLEDRGINPHTKSRPGLSAKKRKNPLYGVGVKKGPRIGINYAGPYWINKKWRFYLE